MPRHRMVRRRNTRAVNPVLRFDGRVLWESMIGSTVEWASVNELATDYWRYQRLSGKEQEVVQSSPWDCVSDWMAEPATGWLNLLTALVETATDDEVAMVGVHCVEDLLTYHANDEAIVGEIETWARRNPLARRAVQGVWLRSELSPGVAARLRRLGAH